MLSCQTKEQILWKLYNKFSQENPFPKSKDGRQEANWQEILAWEDKRFRFIRDNMGRIERQYMIQELCKTVK